MKLSRRSASLLACLLIVMILGSTAGFLALRGDPAPPSVFTLPPEKAYPEVHDLMPDAEINPARRFASLSYGVHVFLWWNPFMRAWDLENVRQIHFAYVRQNFSWVDIQPQPDLWAWEQADGVVEEVLNRGLHLVARLDSAPAWATRKPASWEEPPFDTEAFGRYCGTLAARYKGRIEAYQIWNEPNLQREWANFVPNPAAYVKLLAACSAAIRKSDPGAVIISAGLSPTGTRDLSALPDEEFLWEMYAAGASQYFDVLGLHAPGYALPPEASEQDAAAKNQARWARFRHVEDMRAIMVANGDSNKQIAITEMGWTTDTRPDSIYSWFGVSQETQADYLVRAYVYAAEHWRPWVGLMVTIYIADSTWTEADEQWWWAITEPAPPPFFAKARPAYLELGAMVKMSDNPAFATKPDKN